MKALSTMSIVRWFMFFGNIINDKVIFPDLVFWQKGDRTIWIIWCFINLEENWMISNWWWNCFDVGRDYGNFFGSGSIWVISNQVCISTCIAYDFCIFSKYAGICPTICNSISFVLESSIYWIFNTAFNLNSIIRWIFGYVTCIIVFNSFWKVNIQPRRYHKGWCAV